MSTIVTLNGIQYSIPSTGEVGWGQEVSSYLIALGSGGVLTLEGGNFTLLNEVNFGPNFGLASPYFRSGLDPAATAGVVRLTNSETIQWRNASNTGNLSLYVVGNTLYFNGNAIGGTGTVSPLTTKGDIYVFGTDNTRLPVGLNGQVLTADSSTSTGLAWTTPSGGGGGSGTVVGFNFVNANGISGVVANSTTTPTLTLTLGAITPLSVSASGTITASNISGSTSGVNTGDQVITLTGAVTGSGTGSFATTYNDVVPLNKGGTGQTTANAALNALLPTQASNSGKVLTTDGTNTSWQAFPGAGSVTSVSVNPLNGVTGTVSNPTTTPTLNIGLGDITPTSVAATGTVTGSNISGTVSGTNTGDQTISLTGDVTGSGTGTFAATLSNTGVSAGSYTRANITVDAKGRITSAANGALQTITLTGDVTGSGTGTFAATIAPSGVSAGTYNNVTVNSKGLVTNGSNVAYLTGNQTISITGDGSGSGTTSIPLTLSNTGVSAGTYTRATITVDAKGRITSAATGSSIYTTITVGGVGESFTTSNAIDASVANISRFTLSGTTSIPKPTNIPSGVAYTATYFITQNSVSTLTWFSTIRWQTGIPPVMTPGSGKTDIYVLTTFDGGSTWFGTAIQDYS